MKKREDENKKQHFRPQTCRNCGVNGHLYKDCLHPIMSFGIICYKLENSVIKYIMIQRKDSLSFMEFVRGKYMIDDIPYIKQLLDGMTRTEKVMLTNSSFDEIWNYTWCQNNQNGIKHTKEYIESKQKFEYIMNYSVIKNLLTCGVANNFMEPEWSFPKGRRKIKEDDLDCAVREFCEETQLTKDDIKICESITPFQEIFFGTNNVLYKHLYYIARLTKEDSTVYIDSTCMEQVREVRALEWFDYDEVLSHIKKHNVERIEVFKQAHKLISEMHSS